MPTDPYPLPTAVYDRSAVTPDACKTYCKIDSGYKEQDDEIDRMLSSVKRDVDKTLWNYFTDNDLPSGNKQDIPEDVEQFILRRFARLFDWRVERQGEESLAQTGSAKLNMSATDVDDYEPIMHLRDPLGLVGF